MIKQIGQPVAFLGFFLLTLTLGIMPAYADSSKCGDWDLAILVDRHADHEFAVFPVYPRNANEEIQLFIVECINPPSFMVNGSVTWSGLSWNTFTCFCHAEFGCEYSHDMNPGTPNTVYWNDSGGCTTTGIFDQDQNVNDPETWDCEDLGHPPTCY